jgi:hypothetical protein
MPRKLIGFDGELPPVPSRAKYFDPSPEAFCREYGRSIAGAITRKALNSKPLGQ